MPETAIISRFLLGRAGDVPDLVGVVLFGSAARGDYARRSDIDLLFIFDAPGNPNVTHGGHIAQILGELENLLEGKHPPTGFGVSLDLEGVKDELLENVENDGVVLWARPAYLLRRRPSRARRLLLHYRTEHLTPAERGRVQRYLFGHTTTKVVGRKRYVSTTRGVVEEAEHPAPATLALDPRKARTVVQQLRSLGARVAFVR